MADPVFPSRPATLTLDGEDPIAVRSEILAAQPDFWDGRDTTDLHHPVWFRQFAAWGIVVRDPALAGDAVAGIVPGLVVPPQPAVVAYLLGVVSADGVGYVHLVATRRSHRQRGLARHLWSTFEAKARAAGARELQAITTPTNAGSIAFHKGLGLTAVRVPDYTGPGEDRILFRRQLSPG